jgi:hypothetical protein
MAKVELRVMGNNRRNQSDQEYRQKQVDSPTNVHITRDIDDERAFATFIASFTSSKS